MERLTETLKELTLDLGADFVGIASAEAMNESARQFQTPEENLPGAKAVVSFGLKMLDAIFESPNIRVARMSYNRYHDKLDEMAWAISERLEREGYAAIPMGSAAPVEMKERGGVLGDISQRHAAVEAGLGKVGLGQNFLHPQYGARVRLGSVITRAPLVADRPLEEDICLGQACRKCLDECPGQALSEGIGNIHIKKCLGVMHKYNLYGLLKLMGKVLDAETVEEKKELLFDGTVGEIYMSQRTGDTPLCIHCIGVCPVGRNREAAERGKAVS